jgi:hypothetical protein
LQSNVHKHEQAGASALFSMAPTQETPATGLRFFFRERTSQVRCAGMGGARISDAPGVLSNRAGDSLRLLAEQAPESRVL